MLYRIIRPVARLALHTHFRKIYLTNAHTIPWDKPVILAANHPTSFIEPCLLATHLPKPLYFLARGNLFKKSLYSKFLYGVHILPIFRMKDGGYSKIKNNFSTFEKSFNAIAEGKTILIMAEGRCIQEKRLRPIRKGTARLAFGTIEKHGDVDIQIVPVGVNYTYPNEFRSEVMIDFGPAIPIRKYINLHRQFPHEATRRLTNQLEASLRNRIVIIDEVPDEPLTEFLLQQHRNDHPDPVFPIVSPTRERLMAETAIAQKVNHLDPSQKKHLKTLIQDYRQLLRQHRLDDWALANPLFSTWRNGLIVALGALPFLLGSLGNLLPLLLTRYIVRTRVRHVEDKMSVGIAVGIVAYLLYFITLLTLAFVYGNTTWVLFVILLPVWGYVALMYIDFFKKWWPTFRFNQLNNAVKTDLAAKRKAVQSFFLNASQQNNNNRLCEN